MGMDRIVRKLRRRFRSTGVNAETVVILSRGGPHFRSVKPLTTPRKDAKQGMA